MRSFMWVVFLVITMLYAPQVLAGGSMAPGFIQPARPALLISGNHEISEKTKILAQFALSGNLVAGINPLLYIGAGHQVTKMLEIQAFAGWQFVSDDFAPSLRFSYTPTKKFWAWGGVEVYYPNTKGGYYFLQGEYVLSGWLQAGVEVEGWGSLSPFQNWSHGGGPNLLFRFGDRVGVDVVFQVRNFIAGETEKLGGQLHTRLLLFL